MFGRVHIPSLEGATEWLNSEPLGPAELRGHVVPQGWILSPGSTPEFSFEHEIDRVRQAREEREIDVSGSRKKRAHVRERRNILLNRATRRTERTR